MIAVYTAGDEPRNVAREVEEAGGRLEGAEWIAVVPAMEARIFAARGWPAFLLDTALGPRIVRYEGPASTIFVAHRV